MESIKEIISVPGLSGVFIGPFDLSFSYGYPGETPHPDVEAAKQKVLKACPEKNVFCAITADITYVERRIREGFGMIVLDGGDGGPSEKAIKGLQAARKAVK